MFARILVVVAGALGATQAHADNAQAWQVGVIAIAQADLVAARDAMVGELRGPRGAGGRVLVLVAEGAAVRLTELRADGTEAVVAGFPAGDVREPATLHAFGRELARGPGVRTAIVFWGHGRGWRGFGGGPRNRATGGRGWGLADGAFGEAVAALRSGLAREIDVLGFDACFMGSWEVARALAPFASILVASPELVPQSGWPLGRLLARVRDVGRLSPAALAAEMVRLYPDGGRRHSSLTAIDLRAMASVDRAVADLAKAAIADRCAMPALVPNAPDAYRAAGAVDLGLFAAALAQQGCSPRVRAPARRLARALLRARVARSCQGAHCEGAGLSIHVAQDEGDLGYASPSAPWNQDPSWSRWVAPISYRASGGR